MWITVTEKNVEHIASNYNLPIWLLCWWKWQQETIFYFLEKIPNKFTLWKTVIFKVFVNFRNLQKRIVRTLMWKKTSSNSRFPVPQWEMNKIMVVCLCICICTLIPFISKCLNWRIYRNTFFWAHMCQIREKKWSLSWKTRMWNFMLLN